MVEELKEASDIKKLIGKNKGEEDPILVAQRFLNIFRQLHIFDQQRREEFNSMILALPPEIRGTFGNLPGGSLLQEYVDELEISKGLQRSSETAPHDKPAQVAQPETSKDSPLNRAKNAPQATIATTAAPVQIAAGEAKIVADASFAQTLSQSVSSALMAANASQNSNLEKILSSFKGASNGGGTAQIVPDEKFANSMAQAFSQALQFSDANKKADIKELIEAVRESRKIELPEGFAIGGAQATASAFTNQTSFAQNIADAIGKVLKPGSFARDNNSDANLKELTKAIRENKGIDVDALSKALVSGLKPLLTNIEAGISSKQQIKVSADDNFSEIITNALTKTFEISEKKRQEQTERLIAGFQDVMRKDKAEKLISDFQKVLQNNASADGNVAPAAPVFASGAFSGGSEQFEKITQEFTKTLRSLNDSRKSESREIAQAIKETKKELFKLLTTTNDSNKDKKQNNQIYQSPESIKEIVTKVAQAQANIFQELAKQQTSELSTIISLALKESQKSSVDTIVETFKKLQENNIQFAWPINQPMLQAAEPAEYPSKSKFAHNNKSARGNRSFDTTYPSSGKSYIQKSIEASLKKQNDEDENVETPAPLSVKETKQNVAEYIKAEFEPQPLEDTKNASGADWGFGEDATPQEPEIVQTDLSPDPEPSHEPENSTLLDTEPAMPEELATSSQPASEEEWEWEYEEEPTDESLGVEGQDWEWEYEEEPTDEEALGVEGQDWEWEYEEEPADEEALGVEGQDWEWEYEEEPADEEAENTALELESDNENIPSEDDEHNLDVEPQDNESELAPADEVVEQNGPATGGAMSSAELLAAVKANKTKITKISAPEIGIAELRKSQIEADPYLSANIGV